MKFQLTPEILDNIDRYIKGELEGEALLSFEKQLQENNDLKEEVHLQQQLFKSIGGQDSEADSAAIDDSIDINEKLQNPELQALSEKIKSIGKEYVKQPPSQSKTLWVRFIKIIPAAAAVLVLSVVCVMFLFDNNSSLDQYYYDNIDWNTELTSFAEKGTSKSEFVKAEEFFKNKEYAQAIRLFEGINTNDELYPYSLMYIGAAHSNLNQEQQALQAFNKLAAMNEFGESSKGIWYAALIHLKQEDKEKAMEVLEQILKDSSNYQYKKALSIIEELRE